MSCILLIHWGSSKEAHIFWASSWTSFTSRIPTSSCHQLGVSTTHPFHSTHLSYSSTGGSEEGSLPLSFFGLLAGSWKKCLMSSPALVGAPDQTLGKAVQPLHPPRFLSPTKEDYAWGNGLGCPLVRPCGTSCSIPQTFSSIGHDSWNGHGCLAGLW